MLTYNLGQNKIELYNYPHSPPPPPRKKSNDQGTYEQKSAILVSFKWGEGLSRCSIYFVQECSYMYFCEGGQSYSFFRG